MKEENKISKRNEEITQNYFLFLDQHIDEIIDGKTSDFMEINQIAKELSISHQHLTDIVQQTTNHHPCYFYDFKIIEKAKQMLINEEKSIAEIAKILTYDPSNFSKFFKKSIGLTPGEFRKANKK